MKDEDTEKKFQESLGFVRDIRITELAGHKVQKKTLLAPFHPLKNIMEFTSWKDQFLPLISWGTIAVSELDRKTYLQKFRDIITHIKTRHDEFNEEIYLDHLRLKNLTDAQFDELFKPLLSDSVIRNKLSVLAELKSLPDHNHWLRYGNADAVTVYRSWRRDI